MDREGARMNRRELLQAMACGVPLMAVSEELADLLSPKRTIFLPAREPLLVWTVYPAFRNDGMNWSCTEHTVGSMSDQRVLFGAIELRPAVSGQYYLWVPV
jgi:hypothetical protein